MTTNRTSWETMQRKQLALSCAKDAKELYAGELEKLRLTLDYLRSLRHWLGVASQEKNSQGPQGSISRALRAYQCNGKSPHCY